MMKNTRRESTLVRDRQVYAIYEEIMDELGELAHEVSRAYIYNRIKERTSLCTKTIAFIINHSKWGGGKPLIHCFLNLRNLFLSRRKFHAA